MNNVLTVMEVVDSLNTENKTPSDVKITLHGHLRTTEIGGLRLNKIIKFLADMPITITIISLHHVKVLIFQIRPLPLTLGIHDLNKKI